MGTFKAGSKSETKFYHLKNEKKIGKNQYFPMFN